jgi:glutamate formiminotransferase
VLECVINISEGGRGAVIDRIAGAAGADLLDVHSCEAHNRSVLTVVGTDAPRSVARAAVELLDLTDHRGAHPRFGVVDVVPFVPLEGSSMDDAVEARDSFAAWIAAELSVPAFLYGPERSLPEVRREAFGLLSPDLGPDSPHPTAGAVAVGARPVLLAWNLWLTDPDLELARRIATEIRGPGVRALGLRVGDSVQVSMNLVDPILVGPVGVYDRVALRAGIGRAELVGLVTEDVLRAVDPDRWNQLDLSADRTIESRLATRANRT